MLEVLGVSVVRVQNQRMLLLPVLSTCSPCVASTPPCLSMDFCLSVTPVSAAQTLAIAWRYVLWVSRHIRLLSNTAHCAIQLIELMTAHSMLAIF